MGKFVFGLILGLIVMPASVYYYFASGRAPVAAGAPPMPFEKTLARKALHARLGKEIPKGVPIPADETNFAAGADVYKQNCAFCHGLPGQPETNAPKGMFPYPTQLFKGTGVTDDPAEESFWKAANGIRMSGMPGFKNTLTNTQLWQVSVLVANADKLPPSVVSRLSANPTASTPASAK